jgi:hypothetical protein
MLEGVLHVKVRGWRRGSAVFAYLERRHEGVVSAMIAHFEAIHWVV